MSYKSFESKYTRKFPQVKHLKIENSKRAEKRFVARFELGGKRKTVHFGLKGGSTYIDHRDKKIRTAWRARHSKIKLADGRYAYMVAGTAESFAYHLLW